MPSPAAALVVAAAELAVLRRLANAVQAPAALVRRAKLLLLAGEGVSNTEIAERLGSSRPTVIAWRGRYAREGLTGQLTGLASAAHRRSGATGAPRSWPPPEHLGITHWSSRLLATELGVSHSTVARVWAEHDLTPWQTQTFKFSTDPELAAKVRDVVGLYLDPPAHAIVSLCGREVPDPGAGAHPAGSAGGAWPG